MVLLTRGRISFGGFLCLPDPFGLDPEFVISPTDDYTTFSEYGSDVCINYLFAFLFLLTSPLCSKVPRPCTIDVRATIVVHVITYYV